jgi:hypothetical protein
VSLPEPALKVSPHDISAFLDCLISTSQILGNHFLPLLYTARLGVTHFLPLTAVCAFSTLLPPCARFAFTL